MAERPTLDMGGSTGGDMFAAATLLAALLGGLVVLAAILERVP